MPKRQPVCRMHVSKTLSLLFLGTSLVTAQGNSPDPQDKSEQDSDSTASGSPDNLGLEYYTLHRWRDAPPPGKRSAIESGLGSQKRGGNLWKLINRQRFNGDYWAVCEKSTNFKHTKDLKLKDFDNYRDTELRLL